MKRVIGLQNAVSVAEAKRGLQQDFEHLRKILMGWALERAASRDAIMNPASIDFFIALRKTPSTIRGANSAYEFQCEDSDHEFTVRHQPANRISQASPGRSCGR